MAAGMLRTIFGVSSLLCLTTLSLHSQVKTEREFRIREDKVPASATEFVRATGIDDKVRWYLEQSQEGRSYEAKAVYQGFRYSIEFDSLGRIQDVERVVDFATLPGPFKEALADTLTEDFTYWNIRRTQEQWKGNAGLLTESVRQGRVQEGIVTAYELEIKGKRAGRYAYYEVYADERGKLLRIREVIQRNTQNMEF